MYQYRQNTNNILENKFVKLLLVAGAILGIIGFVIVVTPSSSSEAFRAVHHPQVYDHRVVNTQRPISSQYQGKFDSSPNDQKLLTIRADIAKDMTPPPNGIGVGARGGASGFGGFDVGANLPRVS